MDAITLDSSTTSQMLDMSDNASRRGAFNAATIFATTVAARICHDISGPLGALAGTLQMALEGSDEEASTLAVELVELLTARVRLLRMAFGGGEAPSPAALQGLLPGLPGAERLRLDLSALPHTLPESLRSITPMLLLLAATALPRGGMIALGVIEGDLVLRVDGPRAGWPERLASCAQAGPGSLADAAEPRGIAALAACLQARALGREIKIESPTSLRVSAVRSGQTFPEATNHAS